MCWFAALWMAQMWIADPSHSYIFPIRGKKRPGPTVNPSTASIGTSTVRVTFTIWTVPSAIVTPAHREPHPVQDRERDGHDERRDAGHRRAVGRAA
jgi:hypothetical protein